MSDVLMRHTDDGGEITIEGGLVLMQDGLETAVYLSLFGGEERDRGTPETASKQWWANLSENDPARRYRSETASLLANAPITTATARAVENASARDLAWLTAGESPIASSVATTCTLPARNRIRLRIEVVVDGRTTSLTFEEIRA